jgi:aspartokinase/homoserine dehydrogenase 1
LGFAGINVIAIAQGSSELNISVVVSNEQLKKALNVIHEGFFLSEYSEIHLFLCGVGTVGGSLLKQISQQEHVLKKDRKLKIKLVGICRSKTMIIKEKGIDIHNYEAVMKNEGVDADLNSFVDSISKLNLRNSIFIDCTAEEAVSKMYKQALQSYASVVTANKIACSSEYSLYSDLVMTARNKGVRFMYETNVGAGLPIIKTFDDLINSGDKILKLEAVLSGTLNYIFNVLSPEIPLSLAIKQAKELGFSEPDPRIDLSGIDVVRKILILSRQAGYRIEKEDVDVKTFLPDECFEGSPDDFWDKVKQYDEKFENDRKQLAKEGKKWIFVAKLNEGKAFVELMAIDSSHPAFYLDGSNNIILITTERYKDDPMVIKGYGAGAEVTAAGVFADIIRVSNI